MSTPSGKVSQNNLSGSQLLYTDTGTYGTVSSRILTIYDYNGNLLVTYNMGANLTQTYNITQDGAFTFICTVIDNTGTWTPNPPITFVATGFYIAAYLERFNNTNCGCDPKSNFIDEAEQNYSASLRMNIAGNLVAAQNLITAANTLINTY